MRDAINNNPVVQIAVIGVMVIAVGLLFSMRVLKKEEPVDNTITTSASISTPQGTANITAEVTPSAEAIAAGATGAPAAAAPVAETVTPQALKPGPGLPAEVVNAWKGGNAVALLIVKPSAVDDRMVRGASSTLSGRSDVTLFVVPADKIARYSRVTQPVNVNRVPALVVIRPKRLSGGTPEAIVIYGFRTPANVVQAVEDAAYSGKTDVPYYPR